MPQVYNKACNKPIEHKVLFTSRKGPKDLISPNFELMKSYIATNSDYEVDVFNLGYPHISTLKYLGNAEELAKRVAAAEIVFSDDASDILSCLPIGDETTIINLWHGCGAFKKFGMSTAESKFGGTRQEKLRHPFYENLSLVSVSAEKIIPKYIEAMALEENPEIVQALGVSRTDIFFDEEYISKRATFVRKGFKNLENRKIVLYAPTFRGHATSAVTPDALNLELMARELSNDYILLIKNHPYVRNKSRDLPPFAYDVSSEFNIEDLLMAADICITDYSSVSYEYSLLNRPLIYCCFDKDDYEDWRGFYYPYEEITPGPKCMTTQEVIDAIKSAKDDKWRERRAQFRSEFMSACDGHSTERIWKRVLSLHKS